ncbi:MAG: MFS transporter [Deltaproteobacteria bacterium]|nr:MFS transporter [Deltaproteobacteria bacterium]
MKHIVRALNARNYRLFFIGQGISLIGTWMTMVATSWLVYRLTDSPFWLGLANFTGQLPVFLFAAFAGVWIERRNLHRILFNTQILAMLQSFALAFLTLTHLVTLWQILLLGFLQGMINVFDMPTRQSFVVEIVEDKKNLGNAIALNTFIVNVARLIGPTLAGLIIAGFGEGACFLIDGCSYIAVLASLGMMDYRPREKVPSPHGGMHQLREGASYAFGFPPIRNLLLLSALFSLMGMSYMVLMPIFAGSVFRGGAHTYGFLMAASGLGALIGAVAMASKRTVLGLGKMIVAAGLIFSVCLAAFAFSRTWIVDDDKRARLMSLYAMAFIGMVPFGSLIAGTSAKYLGVSYALSINSLACLLGTILFALQLPAMRKLVKPIYVKSGILLEAG